MIQAKKRPSPLPLFSGKGRSALLSIVTLFALAWWIGMTATAAGPGITPDSSNYVTMAKNIVAGAGFSTDTAGAFAPDSTSPVHFWPPGYSLLITLFLPFTHSALGAARLATIFSYSLIVGTVFWLGWLVGKQSTALLAAVAVAVFMPVVRIGSFALSEATFSFLSIMAVIGFVNYFRSEDAGRSRRWLIYTGFVVGLSAFTRYVGIIWIGVGGLMVLAKAIYRSQRLPYVLQQGILFGFLSSLFLLPWLVRNWLMTGFMTGFNRVGGSHLTIAENSVLLLRNLAQDFTPPLHLGLRDLASQVPGYAYIVIGLFLLGIVTVLFRFAWRNGRQFWARLPEVARDQLHVAPVLVFASTLLYLFVILILASVLQFPPYDWPRLLAVIYPLIWIIIIFLLNFAARLLTDGRAAWQTGLVSVGLALVVLVPFGRQAIGFVGAASSGHGFTATEWRESPGIAYLRQVTSSADIIYSQKASVVTLYLEKPVKFLPYVDEIDQFQELLDKQAGMETTQLYILVFKGELGQPDPFFPERLQAAHVATLARERSDLQLLNELDDAFIYVQVVTAE